MSTTIRGLTNAALLALGLAVTLASGVLQGRLSDRWGQANELLERARRLQQLPQEVPGWSLRQTLELSEDAIEQLQCPGYIQRVYVHEATGEAVNLAVLVGPPGPMSVHTPEICFSTRDYEFLDQKQRFAMAEDPLQPAELWSLTLGSRGVHGGRIRVCYGWSDGGAWQAPEQPRFSLAGSPYLYKLQIAGVLPFDSRAEDQDSCTDFLRHFLPLFRQHLRLTSDIRE